MKTLCILHTTPVTIDSLGALAKEIMPEIKISHVLDTSILPEIIEKEKVTTSVKRRFLSLLNACIEQAPDGILIACSTIGELTTLGNEVTDIPIFRIDEAMCEKAVQEGHTIGVAATLSSTLIPTKNLLLKKAEQAEKDIVLIDKVIENTNHLLGEGKTQEYKELVSQALRALKEQTDLVLLAQASMAIAVENISEEKERYLTSPRLGLEYVKCML